jgi:hypothetical protein
LPDVTEPDIKLTENKLTFSGKSSGKLYTLDLELVRFLILFFLLKLYSNIL